jgi:hypothetical protein
MDSAARGCLHEEHRCDAHSVACWGQPRPPRLTSSVNISALFYCMIACRSAYSLVSADHHALQTVRRHHTGLILLTHSGVCAGHASGHREGRRLCCRAPPACRHLAQCVRRHPKCQLCAPLGCKVTRVSLIASFPDCWLC